MNQHRAIFVLLAFLSALAPAAVTTTLRYPLGELGTLGTSNLPLDATGNGFNISQNINGAATTLVTTGIEAVGSGAALHFNGVNQGFYGDPGNLAAMIGTNNFGVETWVRTANTTQEGYNFVFSLTGDSGATGPVIHLANGRWSASIPGVDWIGGNPNAVGGGVPAVANKWTRVAVARASGVFTLYVDGVAHPMTTTATPNAMSGFHMAVNPGGATYFEGDIDETRVFAFAAGAFNPATDLYQPAPIDLGGQAVITEFSANNNGPLEDQDGAKSDWIELYNPTAAYVQLSGWRLTDDVTVPAKWTFPATLLGPEQRLVVFASAKNRAVSGNELHTNFSLDQDGEYVALSRPDGSIATAFTFPRQKPGASYGTGRILEATPISTASAAKFKAMTSNALGATWTLPAFDDSLWTVAQAAVGYDDGIDDGSGLKLQGYWKFDSASGATALDSSIRGLNGSVVGATFTADSGGRTGLAGDRALDLGNGSGKYVYWPQAANGVFDALTTEDKFSLSIWVYGGAELPMQGYLFNMNSDASGNGVRQAFAHVPWTDQNIYFDTGGCCGGDTRMNKLEADTTKWKGQWNHYVFLKNGDQKEIWQNGVRWHSATNTAPISLIRGFFVASSHAGKIDELAVWAGALSPAQIQALAAGAIAPSQLNNHTTEIATQVRAAMYGVTKSAMLRVPFTLNAPPAWDELRLRIRFDDAFVAYLNGVEIARRNLPASVTYNSTPWVNRAKYDAFKIAEDINITAALALLNTNGQPNVLAIHGINDSLTSPEFFIAPQLVAYRNLAGRHFNPSTPGASNDAGFAGYVVDTSFSLNRGFFDTPQATVISTPTTGAAIYYTLDGSIPGPGNPASTVVGSNSASLGISSSRVVRAMATRPDWMPTNVDTNTYLFPNYVISQSSAPVGFPSTWGVYGAYGPQAGQPMIADYAISQSVVSGAQSGHTVRDGILAIPALCITIPTADLFDATTGMYSNSTSYSDDFTKAATMELIYPDGVRSSIQSGVGLRIHGGLSRQHWHSPKHSFSLLFRQRYGNPKLDYKLFDDSAVRQWDELVLRASSTDSFAVEYVGTYEYPNDRASYIRDPWMKDSFADMGHATGHSRFVNLFLNGLYWGQYNLAEIYEESWHAETYGGAKEDYDVVKDVNELENGSRADWDAALTLAAAGFPDDAAFYRIQGRNADGSRNLSYPVYLDVPNLIDFMILHIYATARDWPVHNWWGGRRRAADSEGFRFYPWDQEITNLNLAWIDTYSNGARFEEVNSPGTPAAFYDKLRLNPRFQRMFGDRVQAVCFNNGPLTPAACSARWIKRQTEIDKSIVAESARWGDARQATSYTRQANWLTEMNWVANTWWAGNHPQALARFRRVSLFPNVVAPMLSQHGGDIAAGFSLTLSAPAGTIYFTTNGVEPIALNGTIAPSAQVYTGPVMLNVDTVMKVRALSAGAPSALAEATFLIASPAGPTNLVVSEIHYHPPFGGYEFVELMNVSATTIDIGGVELSDAISYTIPPGTKLAPGERIIITEPGAVVPNGIRSLGPWVGSLNNGGETLVITAADGTTNILTATFPDLSAADGPGASLTLIRPHTRPNPSNPASWRASTTSGGTPGTTDAVAFTGTATADIDQDGLAALLEYALGTSDTATDATPVALLKQGANLLATFTTNPAAEDAIVTLEYSLDVGTWQSASATIVTQTTLTPNKVQTTWQFTPPVGAVKVFVRVKAAM